MHQPKTAGCSQPFAVGSRHPALRSIHAAQNVEDSSFHPFKSRAAEPARLGPTPCTQMDGSLLACCHVAAMLLLSAPFPPPPAPPPPPRPVSVPSISRQLPLHPLQPPPSRAPTSRRIRNPRAVNQDTIRNRLPFFGCLLCRILSRSRVIRPSILASCKSAQAFSIVGTPGDLGDLWQGPRPVM
jgi:hypothetical protein